MTGCGGAALVWGARAGAEDVGGGALVVSSIASSGVELAGEGTVRTEVAAAGAAVVSWSVSGADGNCQAVVVRGGAWAEVDTAVTASAPLVVVGTFKLDSDEVCMAAMMAPVVVVPAFDGAGWLSTFDVPVGRVAAAVVLLASVVPCRVRICSDSDPAGVSAAEVAAAGVDDAAASVSESVAAGPTTGPAAVAEAGTVALFTALVVGAVGVPGST